MSFLQLIRIIVREFLADLDVAQRLNPNASIINDSVAVGHTRMIDEARLVSVDSRVYNSGVINREQHGVMGLAGDIRIARVRLLRSETFAGIFDQSHAFGNRISRKCTEALHG